MDGQDTDRVSVVGIGASAGGIEALREFFGHTPSDSGMAFAVVLHLPENHTSILADILARHTAMPIVVVESDVEVLADHVYLPPAGAVMVLASGRLRVHERIAGEARELSPVTVLFNSLAHDLNEAAVGVVLSGTGNDGALGLRAIKEMGGLTLVQGSDGSRPQHVGMPSSAIATGAVDIVTPVELMAGRILALVAARRAAQQSGAPSKAEMETARLAICDVLKRQMGHDFSGYKAQTFLRRVARRMQVLELRGFDAFLARLESDQKEVVLLFRDLLIGVTSFFRDAATFDAIREIVVPQLFAEKGADKVIRVWVPGCSTGEEAYSLAILLREHAEQVGAGAPRVQVFATDIDEAAIAAARAGRYPSALLQGMSAERLSKFFDAGLDGGFTVGKSIREICTFSTHSLVRDPPFSRMDLLSCRNLLIYLDLDQQAVVIPSFHYSLVPGGILLLGGSETVNRHERLFAPLDRSRRIFQRRDVPSPPLRLSTALPQESGAPRDGTALPAARNLGRAGGGNWADTRVLEGYAPGYAVVTADGNAVQYSAHLSRFLDLPPGQPSQNVVLMARSGLGAPLRAVLRRAVETGRSVERRGVSVLLADGRMQRLALVVEPRRNSGPEPLFLIVFLQSGQAEEIARPERSGQPGAGKEPGQTDEDAAESQDHEAAFDPVGIRQLEADLRDTRDQLQLVTEEHDTAVEELRSANEELHSVNEELQSTNEELETSKEEIQSINEELQTVNGQLASSVDELGHRNADLKNLFDSTQVATIFLDPYMVIRGFTPAIGNIYNLIPSDQGRPLTDIVSRISYDRLREDCEMVLRTLEPLERRVTQADGSAHYLMRLMPYRKPDSGVDGTIVTFVDVTSIVKAEQHQRLLVDELNHRVKNMLTVVISLAQQTARRAETLEAFGRDFSGRVHALATAYSLLSSEEWKPVSLRSLLREELRPFIFADRQSIHLEGPDVLLEPRAALALGLAVHELTTNAVKYGALSTPDGVVEVQWRQERAAGGPALMMMWVESGGPPVTPPERQGFGSMLIVRGLRQDMAAEVELEFPPGGVRARIRAPLPVDLADPA